MTLEQARCSARVIDLTGWGHNEQ
ncbi:hypothetical protein LCGC14_3015680, partial [marine sediment metagenome]